MNWMSGAERKRGPPNDAERKLTFIRSSNTSRQVSAELLVSSTATTPIPATRRIFGRIAPAAAVGRQGRGKAREQLLRVVPVEDQGRGLAVDDVVRHEGKLDPVPVFGLEEMLGQRAVARSGDLRGARRRRAACAGPGSSAHRGLRHGPLLPGKRRAKPRGDLPHHLVGEGMDLGGRVGRHDEAVVLHQHDPADRRGARRGSLQASPP